MKRLLVVCGVALCSVMAGCSPAPDYPMDVHHMPMAVTQGRFRVERIGVIEDNLAFGERRGLYLIHDDSTGVTFVGLSGVGISELGCHSTGKVVVPDER